MAQGAARGSSEWKSSRRKRTKAGGREHGALGLRGGAVRLQPPRPPARPLASRRGPLCSHNSPRASQKLCPSCLEAPGAVSGGAA